MNVADIIKNIRIIENNLVDRESDINLNGIALATALIEHPSLLARYDQLCAEAKYYLGFMDIQVKKIKAERVKFIRDSFGKEYTDTAIQKVVDGDPQYVSTMQVYNEVEYVYDRCKSVTETFKRRAYILNNIVKVHEHELEHIIIRKTK